MTRDEAFTADMCGLLLGRALLDRRFDQPSEDTRDFTGPREVCATPGCLADLRPTESRVCDDCLGAELAATRCECGRLCADREPPIDKATGNPLCPVCFDARLVGVD